MVGQDAEQREHHGSGRPAGEDRADRSVEVEEQAAGAGEQLRQLVDGAGAHGVVGRLTVVQIVSNQFCSCSTCWLPVEASSSVVAS